MSKFIGDDFVRLRRRRSLESESFLTLAFGDEVDVLSEQGGFVQLRALTHFDGRATGWARNSPPLNLLDQGILKISMVDVQQGDGLVMESPSGKIVLIDGGDNKLFARLVAARFRHRRATAANPLPVEAIIVTHGDADHFDGLNDIKRSESDRGIALRKRLFIHLYRVYHNGLVKMPSSRPDGTRRPDAEMFGKTLESDDELYATDLHEDPRDVDEERLNEPFKRWVKTLRHWAQRGPINVRRIAGGADRPHLFDFLDEDSVHVEIQAPFVEEISDPASGGVTEALRFFRAPKKSADMHLSEAEMGSVSASHTINGHSIALRINYGAVRIGLTGDLNRPAMKMMRENLP